MEKGATAAVFGLGTIGLAVIDALREVGAKTIIGVDVDEGKFARAREWGATDLLNPAKFDKSIVVSAVPKASLASTLCAALECRLRLHSDVVLHLIVIVWFFSPAMSTSASWTCCMNGPRECPSGLWSSNKGECCRNLMI